MSYEQALKIAIIWLMYPLIHSNDIEILISNEILPKKVLLLIKIYWYLVLALFVVGISLLLYIIIMSLQYLMI